MGSSAWSDDHYKAREDHRAAANIPTFAHHVATAAAPAGTKKAHPTLDPKGVKVRECRDSDAHPNSHAVAVLLDVTGSMQDVPRIMQKSLPKLMGLLIRKGYLEHPAILVGAIGDAKRDGQSEVPLQIGQFESGIEIENDLTNLFLEGGGGGQTTESYELAGYFMAKHTVMDCFEKRGRKGYLFIIGDEMPHNEVATDDVLNIIGDKLQANIPTSELFAELKERWEIFYIMPKMTAHFGSERVLKPWKQLLGQNVLLLDDPAGICELIASTVGVAEGTANIDSVEDDLVGAGATRGVATSVKNALVTVAKGRGNELAVASSGGPSGLAKL